MKRLSAIGSSVWFKQLLGAAAAFFVACNAARATLFTIDVTAADNSQRHDSLSTNNIVTLPDGTQQWKGTELQPGAYVLQYDLLLDSDPSISGAIAYTNSTSGVQTVSMTISLPVAPTVAAGATAIGSSALTLADANTDGAASVLPVVAGAIYNALINANVVHKTLFDDPLGMLVSNSGGVNVGTAGFGDATAAAVSAIGIQYNFRLSAGDTVTLNSTFAIVPEPATVNLALAAVSMLLAARYRRRLVLKRQKARPYGS